VSKCLCQACKIDIIELCSYYGMCCKIKKYYVSSCIALSCVIGYTISYVQCRTYINSRGAALIKVLTKLLQIFALTVL